MNEQITIQCPLCVSTDIEDISTYGSNGIFGPGAAGWKITDLRACNKCGIVFKPVVGNGLQDEDQCTHP